MAIEIITKEDLQIFRFQLLDDLKNIIHTKPHKQKQWLKSSEVRKLLKISPGTLQNLRINGTLSFTKIGSIIYYNYDDIETMLDQNNTKATPTQQQKNANVLTLNFKQ
jgi:hypothetical protein